jgi:hypothetical protein
MYLLHTINSDRQTQLLNVLGQIAMYWEEKKNSNLRGEEEWKEEGKGRLRV